MAEREALIETATVCLKQMNADDIRTVLHKVFDGEILVAIVGNVVDGVSIEGPFFAGDDSSEYQSDESWVLAKVFPPEV